MPRALKTGRPVAHCATAFALAALLGLPAAHAQLPLSSSSPATSAPSPAIADLSILLPPPQPTEPEVEAPDSVAPESPPTDVPGEEGDLRLVGQVDINGFATGSLQVFHDGAYGAVCNNQFDSTDAGVACRQLGFIGGTSIPLALGPNLSTQEQRALIQGILAPMVLENLACTGEEERLVDCPGSQDDDYAFDPDYVYTYYGFASSGCDPLRATYAFVACGNTTGPVQGDVRLAGGQTSEDGNAQFGRLEVFSGGGWGSVCDRTGRGFGGNRNTAIFTDASVDVACKQLGFAEGSKTSLSQNSASVEERRIPVLLAGATCAGDEAALDDCPGIAFGADTEACGPDSTLFLTCSNGPTPGKDGELRLVDGSSGPGYEYGRLEVFVRGFWSTICDEGGFSPDAAQVACTILGFDGGSSLEFRQEYTLNGAENQVLVASLPVGLASVDCNGTETSLLDCSSSQEDIQQCGIEGTNLTDATVLSCANVVDSCEKTPPLEEGSVRLRGGFGSPCDPVHTGFVEVYHFGEWGAICNGGDDTDTLAADVVCRQLGFPHGTVVDPLTNPPDRPGSAGGVAFPPTGGVAVPLTFDALPPAYVPYSADAYAPYGADAFAPYGDAFAPYSDAYAPYSADAYAPYGADSYAYTPYGTDPYAYSPYSFIPDVEEAEEPQERFWLNQALCRGPEEKLIDCDLGRGFRTNNRGCTANPIRLTVACRTFAVAEALEEVTTPGAKEGDVRLVDQAAVDNWEVGRLELFFEGSWSQVCAAEFDAPDADVACRQLGFSAGAVGPNRANGVATAPSNQTVFPPVALALSGCKGTEASLLDCGPDESRLGRFEARNCFGSGSEGLTLACVAEPESGEEGALRLTDGGDGGSTASGSGILEVFHAGAWGTVCEAQDFSTYDYQFGGSLTESSAAIACRELGFEGGAFRDVTSVPANVTLRPAWLGALPCVGFEESLAECGKLDFGSTETCGLTQRLVCSMDDGPDAPSSRGEARLVGGAADPAGAWAYGRLEVSDGEFFSSVREQRFTESFGRRSAQVACRSLGFASGAQILSGALSALPGPSGEVSTIGVVACQGDEAALADCEFTPVQGFDYGAVEEDQAVALLCSNPTGCVKGADAPAEGDVRLVDLNGVTSGTAPCDEVHFGGVEFFNDGRWGRICNGRFSESPEDFTIDATVVCRQLGFPFGSLMDAGEASNSTGLIVGSEDYEDYSDPGDVVWATDLLCTGKEQRLDQCFFPQDFGDAVSPFNDFGPPAEAGVRRASCRRRDSQVLGVVCRQFEIEESDVIRRL